MHTHLKGRIINSQGISYLVLHDDDSSPGWVRVKALNPQREIRRMRASEIEACVPAGRTGVRQSA